MQPSKKTIMSKSKSPEKPYISKFRHLFQGPICFDQWTLVSKLSFLSVKRCLRSESTSFCSAENLVMLITREQMREQPQYFIKTLSSHQNGSTPPERQLSNFPHPYPSIRDLHREVIRQAFFREIVHTKFIVQMTPPLSFVISNHL